MEYFRELLNVDAVTDESILNDMPPFPLKEELDMILENHEGARGKVALL